jgi:hypothetical protein
LRLKKGTRSEFVLPRPATSKTPAPSRKKLRFSGKKSSKRVRLTWRASTSVSAKSVSTVRDAVRFGARFLATSSPALKRPSLFCSPPLR